MKRKEILLIVVFILIVVCLFFYKSIFFGQIPFPGDLLANIAPFKTEPFLGFAPGGYPNKAQGQDVLSEMYPWRYFSVSQLKSGHIPFWNPYNFSGNTHMQNYQTGIFYPLTFVFFFLPFQVAWTVFILIQPVLAMVFMYLFLRELKLEKIASTICSVAFAFSSYMVVWFEYGNIDHTMLWLPLLLFLVFRFIQKSSALFFLLIVASITCAFLAGYIQGVFYIYVVSISFVVYQTIAERKKITIGYIGSFLLIFLLPVFFVSFQLLPTIELFLQSTRGSYSLFQIEHLLQPWYYIPTLFAPDFFGNPASRNFSLPITYIERVMYVGVPILFFAFYALWNVKNPQKKFFLFLGLTTLLLTFNLPGIKFLYLIPIPLISTTVPTRALSIFIFCVIVLSAYGIDYWFNTKKIFSRIPFIFLGIYFLLWIIVFFLPRFNSSFHGEQLIAKRNLLLPSLLALATVIVFFLKLKAKKMSAVCLCVIVIIDLFYFFQKITPFSPQSLIYPSTPVVKFLQAHAGINRFWGYGEGYIPPDIQTYDGTYSPEGNDPLHIKSYGELLISSINGEYQNLLPRPDANIAPGYGTTDLRSNFYRQTILNLLGVKYLLHIHPDTNPDYATFPETSYKLIWQKNQWQIYENKKALPRFFVTPFFQVDLNPKHRLLALYNGFDLSKTVLIDRKPLYPTEKTAQGQATLLSYLPNAVIVKTQTTGEAFLFLSDNYYPSWQARIDGKPTLLYKADYTFRAVEIPKGNHIVSFSYVAKNFLIGGIVAFVSLLITIGYSIYLFIYGKKK